MIVREQRSVTLITYLKLTIILIYTCVFKIIYYMWKFIYFAFSLFSAHICMCVCMCMHVCVSMGFPWWLSGKYPPANVEDARDMGSILGSGRSPGVGNGNPLQYSCLGNPVERRSWWATVHGVTKSQTHKHMCLCIKFFSPKTLQLSTLSRSWLYHTSFESFTAVS